MITSAPAGPPQPPAPVPFPPYPPHPPVRARDRRIVVAAVVAALVLLLAGGSAAAWWLTRGEDGSPFAGRPRVTDGAAGISYAIPEGWETSRKRLIDAFTSSIGTKRAEGTGGVVLAGKAGDVPEQGLKRTAERAARSNAEFFYPDGGSTLEETRPTTVSGRPAHTVALRVNDGKGATVHLRMTVIAAHEGRGAFLLGITQSADPAARQEIDAVLASASVT
ncbi:hypothetical protein ACH427_30315 [Streptomyces sp. NPDC020379]|uniref:hypothetical protein n=1 Tax=Streptomyces sp. NPDC020379 TaxID=3365071 RepID=UPI0037B1B76A